MLIKQIGKLFWQVYLYLQYYKRFDLYIFITKLKYSILMLRISWKCIRITLSAKKNDLNNSIQQISEMFDAKQVAGHLSFSRDFW